MNVTSLERVIERPWLTYTKALLFILPAIMAWSFASAKIMPMAKAICEKAGLEASHFGHSGWIWPATFFLADWGPTLLVAGILGFVLAEFAAPQWWRRRLVLDIGIWVANLAVLFGMSVLLVIVVLAAAGLARS